jgi:hypothetical protein
MRIRLPLLLIVALAASLITAGCGGDDEETTTTTTTEATATGETGATGPQSEFAQQADEICREGDQEISQQEGEFFGDLPQGQEPPPQEIERFATDVLVPSIQGQIDEISELTPPEGEEDLAEQFVDQAREDLQEVEDDPSLLTQRGGTNPFAETQELASELGLETCAQN